MADADPLRTRLIPEHPAERRLHARRHGAHRLVVAQQSGTDHVDQPERPAPGDVPRLDALEVDAEAGLDELIGGDHLHPRQVAGDDRRRLLGALQRTGVDLADGPPGQPAPKCVRLADALLAEAEAGQMPVENALGVEDVAVPDEVEAGLGRPVCHPSILGDRCQTPTALHPADAGASHPTDPAPNPETAVGCDDPVALW